jgi:hypothetical protein
MSAEQGYSPEEDPMVVKAKQQLAESEQWREDHPDEEQTPQGRAAQQHRDGMAQHGMQQILKERSGESFGSHETEQDGAEG